MPLPQLPRLAPRAPSLRAALAFVAVLLVLGLGYVWLRDSPFVAVDRVTVTGTSGPDAARVRAALEAAARDMTTLHVRADELQTAVAPFASVRDIEVTTDFPHGLRILVRERSPVAAIVIGDQRIAVAGDGTLLRDLHSAGLPTIAVSGPSGGGRITDRRALSALAVLAAAPTTLRSRVRRVYVSARGLTAPLELGPLLYFGDGGRMAAKWAAAARVLADPTSAGATYVDIRLPERPAAGGLEQIAAEPTESLVQSSVIPPEAATATPTP